MSKLSGDTAPEDPPVSVKAALRCGDTWVLLRNDRGEWELPGGRVDADDRSLEDVVRRECREELGVDVKVGELVSTYLFEVVPGRRVTIICFAATVAQAAELRISHEHTQVAILTLDEIQGMASEELPSGYREAILAAAAS